MEIHVYQEGELINNEHIEQFNLNNYDYNNKKESSFVGFVFSNDDVLVSFPKKYKSSGQLPIFSENINSNKILNAKLLMQTLLKYFLQENHIADSFYGNKPNYLSSFPFEALYNIIKYYKKYGIYTVDDFSYGFNSNGKINWKRTISKGEYILSNDNIIYIKPYKKIREDKYDFITECMIDVINKSQQLLGWFIQDLRPIKRISSFNYTNQYIIRILNEKLNVVFVDEKRKLIKSLIDFYSNNNNGGNCFLKIYYFADCWQKMVNKYLNNFFINFDNDNLYFSNEIIQKDYVFDKKKFYVDDANNHYIEPDHFASSGDNYYVFDSKYYQNILELNYKQLCYQFLLSNFFLTENENALIISALFLPGDSNSKLNYNIKEKYSGELSLKTIEYYLNVSVVMMSYVYNKNNL